MPTPTSTIEVGAAKWTSAAVTCNCRYIYKTVVVEIKFNSHCYFMWALHSMAATQHDGHLAGWRHCPQFNHTDIYTHTYIICETCETIAVNFSTHFSCLVIPSYSHHPGNGIFDTCWEAQKLWKWKHKIYVEVSLSLPSAPSLSL